MTSAAKSMPGVWDGIPVTPPLLILHGEKDTVSLTC